MAKEEVDDIGSSEPAPSLPWDYVVVTSGDVDQLRERVLDHFKQGYFLQGGVCECVQGEDRDGFTTTALSQAMCRPARVSHL